MATKNRSSGKVTVRVYPDTTRFRRELAGLLDRIERTSRLEVPVQVDEKKLRRQLDDLDVTVNVDPDTGRARAALATLTRPRRVTIAATVSKKSLVAVSTALVRLAGARVLSTYMEKLGRSLANLDKSTPRIAALASVIAGLGAVVLNAAQGALSLAGSLAAIAPAALALPGIVAGLAVGGIVLIRALKDAPTVLASLKTQFQQLGKTLSANFWVKAAEPIKDLARTILPTLRIGLGGVGRALGTMFAELAKTGRTVWLRDLPSVLANVRASITAATPGVTALTTAMSTLTRVGATYLPGLAAGFSVLAARFEAFIGSAAADGRLHRWIDTGLAGLRQLGDVAAGAARVLAGLVRAADASGGGGLGALADSMQRIGAIVNGPGFQTALRTIFAGATTGAQGLAAALGPLGDMFAALAPTIQHILTIAGTALGKLLGQIATALGSPEIQAGLAGLFEGIAAGVAALGPAIGPLAVALGAVARVVGTLAGTLGQVFAAAITAVVPVITQLANGVRPLIPVLGQALATAIRMVAPLLMALVPVITDLAAQIAPMLLPALQSLTPMFAQLAPILTQVGTTLAQVLLTAIRELVPVLPQLAQAAIDILTAFTPLLPVIVDLAAVIIPMVAALAPALVMLIQVLAGSQRAINTLGAAILKALKPAADFFSGRFVQATGLLMQALQGILAFWSGDWQRSTATLQDVGRRWLATVQSNLNSIKTTFTTTWSAVGSYVRQTLASTGATVASGMSSMTAKIMSAMSSARATTSSAWSLMQATTAAGVNNIASLAASLQGRIQGALAGAGGWLYSAGRDVVHGFVNGITGAIGSAVSAAANLARSALNAARQALDSHSPSKEFARLGLATGQGLVIGMTSSKAKVASTAKTLANLVITAYSSRESALKASNKRLAELESRRVAAQRRIADTEQRLRDRLTKKQRASLKRQVASQRQALTAINRSIGNERVERAGLTGLSSRNQARALAAINQQQAALSKIAAQRESIAARLKTANEKLQDAVKVRDDFAKTVREQVAELGDVTRYGPDPQAIITNLRNQVALVAKFRTQLAKLKKLGLGDVAYEQIIAAGAGKGSEIADALLTGGRGAITQINKLQKDLSAQGAALGSESSRVLYQAGVNAAQGLINGLRAQDKALVAAATRIAKTLAATVKKELKIKSPSQVFRDEVGKQITAGVIAGIDLGRPELVSTMTSMITPDAVNPSAQPSTGAGVLILHADAKDWQIPVEWVLDQRDRGLLVGMRR